MLGGCSNVSATSTTSWDSVVAELADLGAEHSWARSLLDFARQVSESPLSQTFFPNLSTLQRKLFLAQTREYEIGRNVLEIHAGEKFEFIYRDSAVNERCWRRVVPPRDAFAMLEKFVDQLHVVVTYRSRAGVYGQ